MRVSKDRENKVLEISGSCSISVFMESINNDPDIGPDWRVSSHFSACIEDEMEFMTGASSYPVEYNNLEDA